MLDEEQDDSNTIFREQGTVVVQDGDYRVLVFRREGENGAEPYCHEQAEVHCGGKEDVALVQLTSSEGQPENKCGATVCSPDITPNLSYIRSMIGGAIRARGGAGKVGRIVSIGLGAGSVPLWFQSKLPHAQVDNVDVSSAVIDALPCFGVRASDTVRLHEADGRKYVEDQEDGSADVVFVDAFDDKDYIPPCLQTVEFFQSVKRKLGPRGVLAMNVWQRELGQVYSSISQAFDANRLELGISPGLGNYVVLARGDPEDPNAQASELEVSEDAQELSSRWADDARFTVAKDVIANAVKGRADWALMFAQMKVKPLVDAEACHAAPQQHGALVESKDFVSSMTKALEGTS